MSEEAALLRAIVDRPAEAEQTWLVLADWLDERDRSAQAELIRLQYQPTFRPDLDHRARYAAITDALIRGVRPCVPRWANQFGMVFVWIASGSFTRGTPPDEPQRDPDETQHRVTLTRGFWLADTPVTVGQWRAVTGQVPNIDAADDQQPAEDAVWSACVSLCERLQRADGQAYRLPTEAEWEWACRAGSTTAFHFGDAINTDIANYDGNFEYGGPRGAYPERSLPVRTFPPNVWGLYEMHGNLAEWCSDFYGNYPEADAVDPQGSEMGENRVLRGGSWFLYPWNCRSGNRNSSLSESTGNNSGVRPCFFAEGHP